MDDNLVSAMPSTRPSAEDYQMATLDLPSEEALAAIGRAVVRFAQLEYVLKVIYKRTSGEPLNEVIKRHISLGGLLFGQYESGENKKFEGLINLAKEDAALTSIREQLDKMINTELVQIRNNCVHNGIGRNAKGNFFFLKSGKEIAEGDVIEALDTVSSDVEEIIPQLNQRIPF